MSHVIRVDFHKRERISDRVQKQYPCSTCKHTYYYDSKYHQRVPLLVQVGTKYICAGCVESMYSFIQAEKEADNAEYITE